MCMRCAVNGEKDIRMGYLNVVFALIVCMLAVYVQESHAQNSLAHGFNDDINWVSFEEGKKIAEKENKPLMLLIHKSWCGACKALKPQVATSNAIEAESEHFVMVNTEDDDEPVGSQFSPDGGYIPRVLFLSPDGNVVKDIYNEQGSASYKYYYPSADMLASGMKRARAYFENTGAKRDDEL